MKISILFLLIINFVFPISAQVNIIDAPEEHLETYVYDSLCNISKHEYNGKPSYKYLKGQTLICASKKAPVLCEHLKDKYEIRPTEVGTQFEVIDVFVNDHYYQEQFLLKEIKSGKIYKHISDEDDNYRWIVLGYYEKIKNTYVGKNFVYIKCVSNSYIYDNDRDEIISFDTNEQIRDILAGSLWKCTDISIKLRDPKGSGWSSLDRRCPIILIFENPQYGKCYCYLEDEYGKILKDDYLYSKNDGPDLFLAKFQEENEYKEYKTRKKLETEKRKVALAKKYGNTNAALILEGKVRIGMTKKMCIEAWGNPIDKNSTTGSYGTHEQWVYRGGSYLYFENGILTTIQK